MWRLWNKLFGWDYITWASENSLYRYKGVARIRLSHSGGYYSMRGEYIKVTEKNEHIWLTCKPSKYEL